MVRCSIYNKHSKRGELIRYLVSNGAFLYREGSRHSIYRRGKYRTSVPGHNEIMDELARKICRDLGITFRR
ncbi:MAG: type II toxin-antitoxin system HicA family toxin [Chloroflexi bacterium]|nr:type II toxin-antitoxin system HicA family toxin [Chloroflexota bacterium]